MHRIATKPLMDAFVIGCCEKQSNTGAPLGVSE